MRRLVGAFSLALTLRLARMVLNLGMVGLLGRYLGDEQIGRLFVAQGVVLILMGVCELGLARIPTRDHVSQRDQEPLIAGSAFLSRTMVGVLVFVCLCGVAWVKGWQDRWLLLIFGLALLTNGLVEISSVMTARNRIKEVIVAQFGGFLLSVSLTLGGLLMRAPIEWFAISFTAEQWFAHFVVWLRYHSAGGRMLQWRWQGARVMTFLKESWQELASTLALLTFSRIDSLMIKVINGDGDAGQYAAAVRVAEIPMFIPLLLASIVLPRLVDLRDRERERYDRRLGDYLALSLVSSVVVSATVMVTAPYVVAVLWGEKFAASVGILQILAWTFVPYALGIARSQYLTAERRLWVNTLSLVIALAVQYVLNLLWIPKWGGSGAAMSVLTAWAVGWLVTSLVFEPGRRFVALQWHGLCHLPTMVRELRRLTQPQLKVG